MADQETGKGGENVANTCENRTHCVRQDDRRAVVIMLLASAASPCLPLDRFVWKVYELTS